MFWFCLQYYGDHRDLHVLAHSFPTRRASDLVRLLPERREIRAAVAHHHAVDVDHQGAEAAAPGVPFGQRADEDRHLRSEEHTSELQSLMRTSYAVFCLT